ncbi:hypothetical protein [Azospirillum sp. sgz301742]
MRTLLLMVLAAFLAVAPLTARAQTVPAPAPAPPAASATIFGMPPAQALVVGIGMIAGGVGVSALADGAFSTIVGAVGGAMIGNWWYATQPVPGVRTPTQLRHQLSADATY